MTTHDIGDLVTLSTTVKDTGGVLTNATMAILVTKPDGTAATTSAISNPSTGNYTATVTPDAAGIWLYKWTASGAVQAVEESQFTVAAFGARLMSLGEAKGHVNIGAATTTYDAELRTFIDSATRVVEGKVGAVVARTCVDVVDAWCGHNAIMLTTVPVMSLTTVASVYTGGTSYAVADLDFDPVTGAVWRKIGAAFEGRLRVTYRAGRSVVPANHGLAARMIVQHLWESQRGGTSRFPDELAPSGLGFSVPRRALELLEPDWTGPGVA